MAWMSSFLLMILLTALVVYTVDSISRIGTDVKQILSKMEGINNT